MFHDFKFSVRHIILVVAILGTKLSGIVIIFTLGTFLTFEKYYQIVLLFFYYPTGKYDNYFSIDT